MYTGGAMDASAVSMCITISLASLSRLPESAQPGRQRSFPGPGGSLTGAYAGWTLAEDLEDMDRSGTATAILSI
jgi:hypothetical protein